MNREQAALAAAAAIDALVDLHSNPDYISRKAAIRAASEGRPAFWSTAQYHDQVARNFLDESNDLGCAAAIETRIKYLGTDANRNPHRLINTLIPLNADARAMIDATRRKTTDAYAATMFKGE